MRLSSAALVASILVAPAALWVAANALVAWGATHPLQQARILGAAPVHRRTPADLRLSYMTVTYAARRDAWWIPAPVSTGSVVLIHGYDVVSDPRSADPAPMLELAAAFNAWGYNSLVIDLGYSTGEHLYSGGPLEAQDIAAAVHWLKERNTRQPVALWGFSDGGHSALLAAAGGAPVAAVVADSAFADAGGVIRGQGAAFLHFPKALLSASPMMMRMFSGEDPANLSTILASHRLLQPTLLIQGTGDRSIAPDNLHVLAALTGGQWVAFAGAGHVASFRSEPSRYLRLAHEFLAVHLK